MTPEDKKYISLETPESVRYTEVQLYPVSRVSNLLYAPPSKTVINDNYNLQFALNVGLF